MPLRGTDAAPKFDGNPRELIRYFDDVEQLADAAGLNDAQRIKATLRYIHRDDAETWETLSEVKAGDFGKFCEAVKELYPGCKEDKSYMRDDLRRLVADQATKTMHSQDDVGDYLRKFRRISTYLISNNRLADPDRDRMFLEGLHVDIRDRVVRRLAVKQPDKHPDDAYTQKDVIAAAVFLLQGPSEVPTSTSIQPTAVPLSAAPVLRAPSAVVKQEYVMTQSAPRPPMNCYFCGRTGHTTRRCMDIESYIASGKVIRNEENRIVLADGSNIPSRIGATLKDEVDRIINSRRREEPPHVIAGLFACSGPEIEVELDIEPSAFLQTASTQGNDEDSDPDMANVRALKHALQMAQNKVAKKQAKSVRFHTPLSSNANPVRSTANNIEEIVSPQVKDTSDTVVSSTSTPIDTSKSTIAPSAQYSYQCPLEDSTANKRVLDSVMQTVVSIPVHDILSIAPEVRKQVKEQMTTRRVLVNVAVAELAGHHPERLWGEFEHTLNRSENGSITAHHSIPLKCIEATVLGKVLTCVLDQGAEIIVMRKDVWQSLGVPLRSDHLMTMESANTNKDATLGVIENLGFDFGAGEIRLQVQVIERANFEVLLGRPFYAHTSCRTRDFINGDQNLTLSDPNSGKEITIATKNWLKVCPRCSRNLHCANHCKVLGSGF
jgi:hypothetical protein